MKQFHIILYAESENPSVRTPIPGQALLQVNFETTFERLAAISRVHIELDGSFVWSGSDPQQWQLDGMLYDRAGRLQRVELKGSVPFENWRLVIGFVQWPIQRLVVHDLMSSQLMTIETFEESVWGI